MNERKNKLPESEIVVRGKFFTWLDNFWYHYKWAVIGVAFAVIVLVVCLWQSLTTDKEDITLVYAGPVYLSVNEAAQLTNVLETVMPYDYDENGQKTAIVSMYEIYSEEQIKAFEAQGATNYVDRNRNTSQYQTYNTYQQTGETSVYFLDPWLYGSIPKEYLCPLSEAMEGAAVQGALADGYGVRLGDTDLYAEYSVVQLLPEDTVICLMNPLYWGLGKSKSEEAYDFDVEMFRALVTFERSEGNGEESGAAE